MMRAHDSNRHGDVSVTYGARVPVVASTKKKNHIISAKDHRLQRIETART